MGHIFRSIISNLGRKIEQSEMWHLNVSVGLFSYLLLVYRSQNCIARHFCCILIYSLLLLITIPIESLRRPLGAACLLLNKLSNIHPSLDNQSNQFMAVLKGLVLYLLLLISSVSQPPWCDLLPIMKHLKGSVYSYRKSEVLILA